MTLLERTTTRRAGDASRAARRHKEAAGKRVDEIGAVSDIAATYLFADRAGDLEMEAHWSRIYQLADDEEERAAAVAGFMAWQRTEQREGLAVERSVEDATTILKTNNPFWLNDGCGPNDSGRAA